MGTVTTAWLAMIAASAYRYTQARGPSDSHLPPPDIFLGSAVIYSLLGLVAQAGPNAARTAGIFGWVVVAGALLSGRLLTDNTTTAPGSGTATPGGKKAAPNPVPVPAQGTPGATFY